MKAVRTRSPVGDAEQVMKDPPEGAEREPPRLERVVAGGHAVVDCKPPGDRARRLRERGGDGGVAETASSTYASGSDGGGVDPLDVVDGERSGPRPASARSAARDATAISPC